MGVGVEVVGEDRPAAPGALAVVAFEARPAHAVAAFEVADAAFGAAAVAVQPPPRALGLGFLAAGDRDGRGRLGAGGERVGGRGGAEAAVERELVDRDVQRVELRERGGQQLVLAGVAGRGGGRQDVAAGCLLYTSPSPRD